MKNILTQPLNALKSQLNKEITKHTSQVAKLIKDDYVSITKHNISWEILKTYLVYTHHKLIRLHRIVQILCEIQFS
jgi:hypothetical protein